MLNDAFNRHVLIVEDNPDSWLPSDNAFVIEVHRMRWSPQGRDVELPRVLAVLCTIWYELLCRLNRAFTEKHGSVEPTEFVNAALSEIALHEVLNGVVLFQQ